MNARSPAWFQRSSPHAFLLILAAAGGIGALTLWAYQPALDAGFVFDDNPSIVNNLAVHWSDLSVGGVAAVWNRARLGSRFVANLTFGLDHARGGLDPRAFHLTNVLIHLAVGAALTLLIVAYLRSSAVRVSSRSLLLAVAGPVAVFLLHPLNTQAVTYIVQRMASLVTLFIVLSLAAYMAGRGSTGRKRIGWFAISLMGWVLALWTKQNALLLPLVLLAYEWCFFGEDWRARFRQLRMASAPKKLLVAAGSGVFIVVLAAGLWRYAGAQPLRIWETFPERDFSGVERVLSQARVQWLYLSLVVWPSPARLNLDYDFPVSRGLWQPPSTLFAIIGILLLIGGSIYLARKRPAIGFPLLAYFILHAVESGPVNLELVYEHRMYLPMTMLALALSVGLSRIASNRNQALAGVLLVVTAVSLAASTRTRNETWSDPVVLARDIADKSPSKARAVHNLGIALMNADELDSAEVHFERAAELDPRAIAPWNALGQLYMELGRPNDALSAFQTSLALDSSQRGPAYGIGEALEQGGSIAEAVDYYIRYGSGLAIQGRPYEGMEPLRRAVALAPESAVARNSLGNVYSMAGMPDRALEEYRLAVESDPANGEALYNLALQLDRGGRLEEALEYYQRFVQVAPANLGPYVQKASARIQQLQKGDY